MLVNPKPYKIPSIGRYIAAWVSPTASTFYLEVAAYNPNTAEAIAREHYESEGASLRILPHGVLVRAVAKKCTPFFRGRGVRDRERYASDDTAAIGQIRALFGNIPESVAIDALALIRSAIAKPAAQNAKPDAQQTQLFKTSSKP